MREISVNTITEHIEKMCIEVNHFLSDDMKTALKTAESSEESELGRQILGQLRDNLKMRVGR